MTADVHSIESRRNIGNVRGLLHSLVPRAKCFCFYDLSRHCTWSSDGADDYEIDNFVADLPVEFLTGADEDTRFMKRTLPSGRTILLLTVGGKDEPSIGVLIGVFSRNAGSASWFNPNLIRGVLLPVTDVICDIVSLGQRAQEADDRTGRTAAELELVYKLDQKVHGTSRSHAGLAQLVGQSGRYLEIAYSVLLLPAKRIRISATHSSWKSVNRKTLDRYLIDSLLPRLDGQREPVVYEVPAVEGGETPAEQGYQVMLCPLLDTAGNVEGALAQLGRIPGTPFTADHMRFMAYIMRKVEYVITQSFDSMTGLMNRSGFEAQISEALKSLEKSGQQHQMIYFDLDNLQLVNDSFGQKAGDEVIKRFGQMIEEALPKNGVATRLTGDDFAVMLTHADEDTAINMATEIRRNSDQLRYLRGDKSLQVTVSAGIVGFGNASGDSGEILTAARIACDAAKDHGRDRIEVYDPQNQSIIRRFDDMNLIAEIQRSLDDNSFELQAQPIVGLSKKGGAPRFEILLRMFDRDGNKISTGAFFSAAERYQLMPQIDRWVVSSTVSALQPCIDWLRETGAVFAVNLSGQTLGDDEIQQFIEDELDAAGIPPGAICFELTESAAVSNRRKAQVFIDALRARGCRFSLDDFGAGLSSFAYLKSFNVDTLKIDGGFIRDITENRISESMVAAITQVAKVMELDTVAEFVESEATRKLVKKLGVDYAQGHAIGKPEPLGPVLAALTGKSQAADG